MCHSAPGLQILFSHEEGGYLAQTPNKTKKNHIIIIFFIFFSENEMQKVTIPTKMESHCNRNVCQNNRNTMFFCPYLSYPLVGKVEC